MNRLKTNKMQMRMHKIEKQSSKNHHAKNLVKNQNSSKYNLWNSTLKRKSQLTLSFSSKIQIQCRHAEQCSRQERRNLFDSLELRGEANFEATHVPIGLKNKGNVSTSSLFCFFDWKTAWIHRPSQTFFSMTLIVNRWDSLWPWKSRLEPWTRVRCLRLSLKRNGKVRIKWKSDSRLMSISLHKLEKYHARAPWPILYA